MRRIDVRINGIPPSPKLETLGKPLSVGSRSETEPEGEGDGQETSSEDELEVGFEVTRLKCPEGSAVDE